VWTQAGGGRPLGVAMGAGFGGWPIEGTSPRSAPRPLQPVRSPGRGPHGAPVPLPWVELHSPFLKPGHLPARAQSWAFGSSTWGNEERRFLSPGHSVRDRTGTFSPANYDHQDGRNLTSFGQQALSSR
jgi:hypothetical protein